MKLKGKKVKKVLKLGSKGKEMEIGDDMLSVSLKAGSKKVKVEISPEGIDIFGSSDLIDLLKELEQKVKKEEVNKNKT
jgi:YbbR domain-containing protein